jgi:hypothetical protein
MLRGARNAAVAIAALFQRHRWIGWTGWGIFVAVALARTHPRRFASTFAAYLDAAQRLQVRRDAGARSFAFALLMLSGCYITLFGPRNEFLSFLVLTPSLAVLAVLILGRDATDRRGWLLILAAVTLGFAWGLKIDAALKPAIVAVIYLWLAWLMAVPARWRALVEGGETTPSSASEQAMAGALTAERP